MRNRSRTSRTELTRDSDDRRPPFRRLPRRLLSVHARLRRSELAYTTCKLYTLSLPLQLLPDIPSVPIGHPHSPRPRNPSLKVPACGSASFRSLPPGYIALDRAISTACPTKILLRWQPDLPVRYQSTPVMPQLTRGLPAILPNVGALAHRHCHCLIQSQT
jgi:hypothetical protein